MNQTEIERYERTYVESEPKCATSYDYGYGVEMNPLYKYVDEVTSYDEVTDVMFAVDMSGSMTGYIRGTYENMEEFMDLLPAGSRVGMYTWNGHYKGHDDIHQGWNASDFFDHYIDNNVSLTSKENDGVEKVMETMEPYAEGEIGGGIEPGDVAIKYGINETHVDWNEDTRNLLIIIGDECANKTGWAANNRHPNTTIEWAEKAAERDIEIHPVRNPNDQNQGEPWDDIAEITGGASHDITGDFNSILREIARGTGTLPGDSTCTLPPETVYRGDKQLVVAAPTNKHLGIQNWWQEWSGEGTNYEGFICTNIPEEIEEIDRRGAEVNLSFYGMGKDSNYTDSYDYDQGEPMEFMDSGPFFDYTESEISGDPHIPHCLNYSREDTKETFNASESELGKAITDWNLQNIDIEYNPNTDHGLSAWAVGTQWILENHNWKQQKNKTIIAYGNDFPTGSGGKKEHHTKKDKKLINTIIKTANQKNITIHTISKPWKQNTTKKNTTKTPYPDVEHYMYKTANQTNGTYLNNTGNNQILEFIEGMFDSEEHVETCGDEMTHKFGKSIEEPVMTYNYPSVNFQKNDMRTIGSIEISLSDSSVERLAGAINRVAEQGERQGEEIQTTFSFGTEKKLEVIDNHLVEKQVLTDYKLHNPETGEDRIEVKNELIIGINAENRFHERNNDGKTEIDFNQEDNHITAYRGANIQLIAANQRGRKYLSNLTLRCVNEWRCEDQNITGKIDLSEGDDEYIAPGVFYHNFTQIKIGETETQIKPAICTPNKEDCTTLHTPNIQKTTIQPGTHQLNIQYNPQTQKTKIQ